MTEVQEKAREIVIKMQFQKDQLMFEQAKKCALIAIDLVKNNIPANIKNGMMGIVKNPLLQYWQDVKTEIENL